MHLKGPRIPPLAESQSDDETRAMLERTRQQGRVFNIFKTLANHPKLLKRWLVFGSHVLSKSTLPARERELLILRTGWLCRSEYEWGQHVVIGRQAGLSDEEIRRITEGPEAPGWSPFDATLLRAVEELRTNTFITDSTWQALEERYDTEQMMDLVFTVGQYVMLAMALNSFGVELDEGIAGFEPPDCV